MVELLFLPSVYASCSACTGSRYNRKPWRSNGMAQHRAGAAETTTKPANSLLMNRRCCDRSTCCGRSDRLSTARQPATELSGGEAQRIKLATELQRVQHGNTLYILDEPTSGLHPADVDRLMRQLQGLVDADNTVVVVEHDMRVLAQVDWIIDLGPGAGEDGGRVVVSGVPREVAEVRNSLTAPYLKAAL